MPVYEYECPTCDKVFEVQQHINDAPLKSCPDCGKPVKKLVSRSSFQLKGGGWYADGYSGTSNGTCGHHGTATSKKESGAPPPCQSATDSCKSCPAAT